MSGSSAKEGPPDYERSTPGGPVATQGVGHSPPPGVGLLAFVPRLVSGLRLQRVQREGGAGAVTMVWSQRWSGGSAGRQRRGSRGRRGSLHEGWVRVGVAVSMWFRLDTHRGEQRDLAEKDPGRMAARMARIAAWEQEPVEPRW